MGCSSPGERVLMEGLGTYRGWVALHLGKGFLWHSELGEGGLTEVFTWGKGSCGGLGHSELGEVGGGGRSTEVFTWGSVLMEGERGEGGLQRRGCSSPGGKGSYSPNLINSAYYTLH